MVYDVFHHKLLNSIFILWFLIKLNMNRIKTSLPAVTSMLVEGKNTNFCTIKWALTRPAVTWVTSSVSPPQHDAQICQFSTKRTRVWFLVCRSFLTSSSRHLIQMFYWQWRFQKERTPGNVCQSTGTSATRASICGHKCPIWPSDGQITLDSITCNSDDEGSHAPQFTVDCWDHRGL